MKKIKIYFWKHGFQTDGVSLWVVQIGKKKWFTKEVECKLPTVGKFQNKNPHAYFLVTPHYKYYEPEIIRVYDTENEATPCKIIIE